jgi:hypothetical protein
MVKCLLLTSNSTYTITQEQAQQLRDSMGAGEKTVRIQLDLFGEGKLSDVCLSVPHIIGIAEYPISDMSIGAELGDRLRLLRR